MDVDQSEQRYMVGGASLGVCMEPLQVFCKVTSLAAQVRSAEERVWEGTWKYTMQFWSFLSCASAGTWVFVIVLSLITGHCVMVIIHYLEAAPRQKESF